MRNKSLHYVHTWTLLILFLFTCQTIYTQTLKITKNALPADDTPFEFVLQKIFPPDFISTWGSFGSNDGQFNFPTGVAVDNIGNVYVADFINFRIQKFDNNGNFLLKWGSFGSGNGQFINPIDIITDNNGSIYVVDFGSSYIQKFDNNGISLFRFGSFGIGNGQFLYPTSIAVDNAGNIFVADSGNHRIQKFDSNGNFLLKWGTQGTGNGQFDEPYGIAVDALGNVYVSEQLNNRVQKFDNNGNYITQWGMLGNGNGQFSAPAGIVVDMQNNIYVADFGNSRIQQFDSNGNYLGLWGSIGSGNGQFTGVIDIAIDHNNNFYTVESNNNRVQKFGLFSSIFTLSDPANNMRLFDMLTAGTYIITESALYGWQLSDIQINGDINNSSMIDLSNNTATIDLDADENIEIIFSNCTLPIINPLTPQTLCTSKKLLLADLNPVVNYYNNNLLEYTWSIKESGAAGILADTDLSDPSAGVYMPYNDVIARGYVTLILTVDNPNDACESVSTEVIITFLKVNCGSFPWNGN
ncbi:MAG: 6-bladed beta-propeller [Saprospiraceae bacterium]|nr:6-bladed beta-propeller [Saprospiraceae bacterium]